MNGCMHAMETDAGCKEDVSSEHFDKPWGKA